MTDPAPDRLTRRTALTSSIAAAAFTSPSLSTLSRTVPVSAAVTPA